MCTVFLFVTLRDANGAPELKKTKAAYSSEHTNNCLRDISQTLSADLIFEV